jgi:tetratricopeptide (TPR) repeat protein
VTAAHEKWADALRRWLAEDDLEVEADVRAFTQFNADDLDHTITQLRDLLVDGATTREVIRRAHALLGSDPERALWIAHLATILAPRVWVGAAHMDAMIELEGDAFREYAAALLEVGSFARAAEAARLARDSYEVLGMQVKGGSTLDLIEGRILHELGRTNEGLGMIQRGSNMLLAFHEDKEAYVKGRTIEAALLFKGERYQEAMSIYAAMSEHAREEEDTELLAYVLSMVGRCRVKLGQLDDGRECIETAIRMFEDLKLFAEVPRLRKGLVEIAVARGRYNEAISELYKMRNAFLSLHLPIVAALVDLDVVDLLMVSGRTADIPALCRKMLATFTEAGLRRNALMALAHIQALAQEGALASGDVQKVRTYLERLSSDPDGAFTTGV